MYNLYNDRLEDELLYKKRSYFPKNETTEHYLCKVFSKILLYRVFNCRYVANEVYLGREYECNKTHIDAIGVTLHKDKVIGIEAKASLSDYKNGFCTHAPYTYIICPKDVIPVDVIPKDIGLIYLDLDKIGLIPNGVHADVLGYTIVKKARKRKTSQDETFVDYVFNNIARQNSIHAVFNDRVIPHYTKQKKRK